LAFIALVVQFLLARGKGRVDHSQGVGKPLDGIIYNFTIAMLPSHKETIRNHPFKFAVGLMMHIGVFLSIIKVLLVLIIPDMPPISPIVSAIVLGISVICGFYLFMRRIITKDMRYMSTPDDYISVLLTIGLIISAIAHETGQITSGALLIYSTVLFFYLPLGKLRHALFFFVARADYGSRLGYRGVYSMKNGVSD